MVKKTNGFFVLLFLGLLSAAFLNSCDECYQCDVYPEPYVNVKFIKMSDLELVNDTIATLIEQLAEERKNEAALTADAPPEQIETIKKAIDSLNAEKIRLEKSRNLLESGSVQIDSIVSAIDNDKSQIFTDSATIFQLPLSMNDTSSSYLIYLNEHSEVETLEVNYDTVLIVEDNRAIIQAFNINDHPTSSFDSTEAIYRDDQQLSNETTIYIYY